MYVETDFLVALVKNEDWFREPTLSALKEHDNIHTSILAYAEVLVLFYDRDAASYDIDVPRAISNLLELVPMFQKRTRMSFSLEQRSSMSIT